jgi:hypothetical protein
MDLLEKAEFLLKGKEPLSEQDRERLDAAVKERDIEPVEQEPGAEVAEEAEPEIEVQPKAGDELEATEVAAESEEMPDAAESEDKEVEEGEEPAPSDLPILEDEEEQIPTFDGEPIKDSIGWVQVEPEEDYYSGWSDAEEAEGEGEEEPQYEWVREDIFGEEPPPPPSRRRPPAKKKAKKRSRPRRESDSDRIREW